VEIWQTIVGLEKIRYPENLQATRNTTHRFGTRNGRSKRTQPEFANRTGPNFAIPKNSVVRRDWRNSTGDATFRRVSTLRHNSRFSLNCELQKLTSNQYCHVITKPKPLKEKMMSLMFSPTAFFFNSEKVITGDKRQD
jgi:hypothetical protein